jgi:hypothetical protein
VMGTKKAKLGKIVNILEKTYIGQKKMKFSNVFAS